MADLMKKNVISELPEARYASLKSAEAFVPNDSLFSFQKLFDVRVNELLFLHRSQTGGDPSRDFVCKSPLRLLSFSSVSPSTNPIAEK
jgi:hypothetical protein